MSDETARQREFLRQAIAHLDDKAKADLKVALYGSAFFLAVSLLPYGELAYCSLIVSVIDLWYFMSWGNDQLRLVQHRDAMKALSERSLQDLQERHPNYPMERLLYFGTSSMVVVLFLASLVKDWHLLHDQPWKALYFATVFTLTSAIAIAFVRGFRATKLAG